MKKTSNLNGQALFFLVLLIPIFGSIALGLILCGAIILSFYLILQRSQGNELKPFKKVGVIFILYFVYYSLNGAFFSSSVSQHIHDIGKIFPILIIGILAFVIKENTINITYKAISYVAVLSIYLTTILALIFRFYPPDIMILGETFSQKTGVMSRLEMGTGNALPFGTIFITFAFLTCLDIKNKTLFKKIISFSALILAILMVAFWNNSRGPLLVVAPLTILMFWYLFKESKCTKNWTHLASGFIAITLTVCLFASLQSFGYDMSSNMVNGLKEIAVSGSHDASVNIRLTLYQAGIKAFITQPFFGFGIGNLFEAIIEFLPKTAKLQYSHVHNMYLNHAIAGGCVGLIFLLLIICSPIVNLWYKKKNISIEAIYLSLLLVIAISGSGMSNVLFFHDLLAGFFCVLILLSSIAAHNN